MDEQQVVAMIATLLELSNLPQPVPTISVTLRYRENLRIAKEEVGLATLGS
jgi:hypothetical protein